MIGGSPELRVLIRGRLLQMLAALERTGCTPIEDRALHAFAFFVNVLSPLWDLSPLDGSVLKEKTGPYYPLVQRELDYLIGQGFVQVVTLTLDSKDADASLRASFRLSGKRAIPVLAAIRSLPDELETEEFLTELAAAFVRIEPRRRDDAAVADASYSNPAIADGRIVDFAEWVSPTRGNPTWRAVQSLQQFVSPGITLNRADKLAMYMRLMDRRAHG